MKKRSTQLLVGLFGIALSEFDQILIQIIFQKSLSNAKIWEQFTAKVTKQKKRVILSTIREFILYIACRAENDDLDVEATKKRITDGIRNGDFELRRRRPVMDGKHVASHRHSY